MLSRGVNYFTDVPCDFDVTVAIGSPREIDLFWGDHHALGGNRRVQSTVV